MDASDGVVYLNRRGTYGIASAAYWWGRLAALLHRVILTLQGRRLAIWLLLFADDWCGISWGRDRDLQLIFVAYCLSIFGLPLSWGKVNGGGIFGWIGYELSLDHRTLGISERRAAWMVKWFSKALADLQVVPADLLGVLGRMSFVYGAIPADRPFLAPLYAFASRVGDGATPVSLPLYVVMVLSWLRRRLQARRAMPVAARSVAPTSTMRVDAKAEGLDIALGGWRPVLGPDGRPDKARSPWYTVRLSPSTAPWAFARGSPAGLISTLELLATTVGLVVLDVRAGAPLAGRVQVTGLTDSQVSANVVTRGQTTAFPLCCVAMELAAQCEDRSIELVLDWVPRDQNAEADALADGDSRGFSACNQVPVDLSKLGWLVLDGLMKEGTAFYEAGVGRGRPVPPAPRAPGAKRLRERDPW